MYLSGTEDLQVHLLLGDRDSGRPLKSSAALARLLMKKARDRCDSVPLAGAEASIREAEGGKKTRRQNGKGALR